MQKTNAMRILDKAKIAYEIKEYDADSFNSGLEVAQKLNLEATEVFKTIVCVSKTKNYYTFVLPIQDNLDLKKCAKACQEKSLELLPLKDLTKITGYVRGGCSPIGMTKNFKTFIDIKARSLAKFYISAGKIGLQFHLNPNDLTKILNITFADLCEV